jgi:hypothetical protein
VNAVAERLDAVVVGFGSYVREVAKSEGLNETSRDVLQALGERLNIQLGADGFVSAVLDGLDPDRHGVVDGVRHVEVADQIEHQVSPRRFVLVFLDAEDDVREERASATGKDQAGRLAEFAQHSTERQVHDGSLRGRADLILDARDPIEQLVAQTMAALQ